MVGIGCFVEDGFGGCLCWGLSDGVLWFLGFVAVELDIKLTGDSFELSLDGVGGI